MRIIEEEIDISKYVPLISESGADLLVPVRIYPRELLMREQFPEVEWLWNQRTAIALACYSRAQRPAGALSLFIAHYGRPTEEELDAYVEDVREQLEEDVADGQGTFEELARDLRGRIDCTLGKAVFVSRVFPGELPHDVSRYAQEIAPYVESGGMVLPQRYHLLHAVNSQVQYFAFRKPEDYSPQKPEHFSLSLSPQAELEA